jgi:hypothetical protein
MCMLATAILIGPMGLIVACSGNSGTNGLIVAPMTSVSVAVAPSDASVFDAPSLATRALPDEPHYPTNMSGCERSVSCVDPEPTALTWPLPSPFERCKPVIAKGDQKFSVKETVAQRAQDQPDTCCYVVFEGCSRRYGGREVYK